MAITDSFIERARGTGKRIVLPEGADARMVAAAARLAQQDIAQPILLGTEDGVRAAAEEAQVDISSIAVINSAADERLDQYIQIYAERREVSAGLAKRLVKKPLYFGAMMVAEGAADGGVAGLASTTTAVIQAATLTIGHAEGASQASSLFIMELPGRDPLIYADAAIVPQPSAQELAEIAVTTARSARALLGLDPLVALLSFSTYGSAAHPDVDKVKEATELARAMAPELAIDGELQADAALSPQVAAKKGASSPVAGHANVLVFPDLDAANIAYKLTQYLAGANAIGPIMQGFARPFNDLSRGASIDDVVAVSAIAAIQAAA